MAIDPITCHLIRDKFRMDWRLAIAIGDAEGQFVHITASRLLSCLLMPLPWAPAPRRGRRDRCHGARRCGGHSADNLSEGAEMVRPCYLWFPLSEHTRTSVFHSPGPQSLLLRPPPRSRLVTPRRRAHFRVGGGGWRGAPGSASLRLASAGFTQPRLQSKTWRVVLSSLLATTGHRPALLPEKSPPTGRCAARRMPFCQSAEVSY